MRCFGFVTSLAVFVVLFVACSSTASTASTTIRVSDYSRACVVAEDCVLALDGDVCDQCPNSAVAKSDARYEADRAQLGDRCPGAATVGAPMCQGFITTCTAGVCGAASCDNPADGGCVR